VSLNRADPRFALPFPARQASVLGSVDGWADGLRRAGVDVLDRPRAGADLVVAPRALFDDAMAVEAKAVVIDGDVGRRLRRGGLVSRRLMARPNRREPALLLALDQPGPTAYAVDAWSVADRSWKRARRTVARMVVPRGWPGLPHVLTFITSGNAPPYLVAAARDHGVPLDAGWVLTLGQGDELSRNAFHLFSRDSAVPSWVLKFARVPGYREPFDRDERGLAAAARAGGIVAARAPRLLARFTAAGIEASLETAAVGKRLREILIEPGRKAGKRHLIDSISSWILDVAKATRRPPAAVNEEVARIGRDVLPRYAAFGVGAELLQRVAALPGVLQHNDLGSWNILVNGDQFVVLDWESAREVGLPLWDTVYFLADALALVDGATDGSSRHVHTTRLFRGELASSALLFGVVGRSVDALGIPPDAVGSLVALCWMHHAQSPVERTSRLARHADATTTRRHGTELNAEAWLSDPALGREWPAWRRACAIG
jgi:hypothetical protein